MSRDQWLKLARQYSALSKRMNRSFAAPVIAATQAYAASIPQDDPQRSAKLQEIARTTEREYKFSDSDVRDFPDNFNAVDEFAIFERATDAQPQG